MNNPIKITIALADEINRLPVAKKRMRELVQFVCDGEQVTHAEIVVIFVGAERMRVLNSRFLKHDYPTDVLAFPFHAEDQIIEGEIYVCVNTAYEQAVDYRVPLKEELMRLTIHGLLHIFGYDDTHEKERSGMHQKGEHYMRQFMSSAGLSAAGETKS